MQNVIILYLQEQVNNISWLIIKLQGQMKDQLTIIYQLQTTHAKQSIADSPNIQFELCNIREEQGTLLIER